MVDHTGFFFNNGTMTPSPPEQINELYSWLCSFINMEQGLGGKPVSAGQSAAGQSTVDLSAADLALRIEEHFKLDRIRCLAVLAGHPELCAPVVHIAGSKGKGSVAAMTASILEAAGTKTARYMSPHVNDWRERICRGDGSFFPEKTYLEAGAELRNIYERYRKLPPILDKQPNFQPGSPVFSGEPTFFELVTLLFFLCARLDECKAMVVETGLGGRLDATNIVNPAVSVITVIEREHTEYLGTALASIAVEKAGIIKQGRPVVVAEQKPEVLEVLQQYATKNAAPFLYLPQCAETREIHIHEGGTDFTLDLRADFTPDSQTICTQPGRSFTRRFSVPIPGRTHAANAALALLALTTAFPLVSEESMERGLAATSLPARFEKIRADPPFIIDGAHTPLSVAQCAETFCQLYGKGGILLFGCAADKDPQAMAAILLPCFEQCIITAPGSFRASDPAAVYSAFLAESARQKGRVSIACIPDTKAAMEETLRLAEEAKRPVLCCGSFYLAAEVRRVHGCTRINTDEEGSAD